MSAEMATEMLDGDARVLLSEAPLVEGAVAAAAAAPSAARSTRWRARHAGRSP